MTDQFDLVVHSFEGSIGDPEFGPGQQTGEMIFDQTCKFDDWLQPGVSGPPEPLFDVGLGSFFLKVIPKPLEFFFQVVSPDDRKVEFKQMREPSVFLGGEVPGVLQQDEASLFEIDALLVGQPQDFCSSDLVDGPIQVLDDMEAIKKCLEWPKDYHKYIKMGETFDAYQPIFCLNGYTYVALGAEGVMYNCINLGCLNGPYIKEMGIRKAWERLLEWRPDCVSCASINCIETTMMFGLRLHTLKAGLCFHARR